MCVFFVVTPTGFPPCGGRTRKTVHRTVFLPFGKHANDVCSLLIRIPFSFMTKKRSNESYCCEKHPYGILFTVLKDKTVNRT